MRMLKSINARFEELIAMISNQGTALTAAEKDKLRGIWYAGFATAHDILVFEVAALSDAQAEIELRGVTDELHAYMDSSIAKAVSSGNRHRGPVN